jgi:serine/threonine protein kinase
MPEDRWDKIEATFHEALELPPHERSAFLDAACSGDAELRREVEALLNETADTKNFMEAPAGGLSIGSLALPSLEGRTLNHYRIGPLIGSGGMAEVYRARDTKLARDVAIKVLHDIRFVDRERLDPVYREARVLASLNQSNIAAIYGIEESDGLCGLVLELVEGESLSERIRRGPLKLSDSIAIVRQILAGLRAAHAKGIIHRDLKPSNIAITADGTVKLVDFGLAKLLRSLDIEETVANISSQGLVMGTVAYMSPEQARGKRIDARTDVWAFGCVFYEMLTGMAAFRGDTPTDIIVKIATEEPDWKGIPDLPDSVSTGIESLIRKCLQKDPNLRYASVQEISDALDALQQNSSGSNRLVSSNEKKEKPDADEEFVLPIRRLAPLLFLVAQAGYLALYFATMYHIDAVSLILDEDFHLPARGIFYGTIILAMCGIAVRLYLISAVGWHHPAAGRKFIMLFPVLLVLDGIWAASPLLIWRKYFGLAFVGVALLAYVPFAQRTLVRTIYAGRLNPGR